MRHHRWTRGLLGTLLALSLAAPAVAATVPQPSAVKGVYLTPWNAVDPGKYSEILGLLERTELNALVVDVKDDSGRVTITADDAAAEAAGAIQPFIPDPKAFTDDLHARGVYAIARIVAFKDPIAAPAYPGLAVHSAGGGIWRDWNEVAWLNPYNRGAWEYVVSIAKEAAEAGFDEIQFDYVRFPTDGDLDATVYPGEDERPYEQVVADFLAYARAELKPLGVPVSADVFGLVTSAWDDMGIGQRLEEAASAADYVSPMLYPSHYEAGNLGLANPNAMPYQTIYRSLVDARERIAEAGLDAQTGVRPWLQDFSWGYDYGPEEVRAQIQATYDAGYTSWLLWNAANVYTEGALLPQEAEVPSEVIPPYLLPAAEVGDAVTVLLNGQPLHFPAAGPFIARSTGRTLIPLRAVAEALGAAVEWDQATRTAVVRLGERSVRVTAGEAQGLIGVAPGVGTLGVATTVALEQPAVLWENSTLVPLRFIAEGLGAQVTWDAAARRVQITTGASGR